MSREIKTKWNYNEMKMEMHPNERKSEKVKRTKSNSHKLLSFSMKHAVRSN